GIPQNPSEEIPLGCRVLVRTCQAIEQQSLGLPFQVFANYPRCLLVGTLFDERVNIRISALAQKSTKIVVELLVLFYDRHQLLQAEVFNNERHVAGLSAQLSRQSRD